MPVNVGSSDCVCVLLHMFSTVFLEFVKTACKCMIREKIQHKAEEIEGACSTNKAKWKLRTFKGFAV